MHLSVAVGCDRCCGSQPIRSDLSANDVRFTIFCFLLLWIDRTVMFANAALLSLLFERLIPHVDFTHALGAYAGTNELCLVSPFLRYMVLSVWAANMRKILCTQKIPSGMVFEVMHTYVLRFLKHLPSRWFTFVQPPLSVSEHADAWHAGFHVYVQTPFPPCNGCAQRFQRGSFDGKRVSASKRTHLPGTSRLTHSN